MLHLQGEGGFGPGRLGQQVQQIPLRHHGDIRVRQMQTAKVDQRHLPAVGVEAQVIDSALRHPRKLTPQAEIIEQSQRAGMHGVAAEVAKEVGVLLQQGDLHAGSGQ